MDKDEAEPCCLSTEFWDYLCIMSLMQLFFLP